MLDMNYRPWFSQSDTPEPSFRDILIHYYRSHGIEESKAQNYADMYILEFEDEQNMRIGKALKNCLHQA